MNTYHAAIDSTAVRSNTTAYRFTTNVIPYVFFNCEVTEGQSHVFRDDHGNLLDMDEVAEPGMTQGLIEFINTFASHWDDEVEPDDAYDAAHEVAGYATIFIENGNATVEVYGF